MEQEWTLRYVKPVLDFASLPTIAHVDQVHRLFAPLAYASQFGVRAAPVLKTLEPGEEAAYLHDRDQVRAWLATLRTGKAAARQRVQAEVERMMAGTVELRGHARFSDGMMAIDYAPVLDGVQACIAFGMALLADDRSQHWRGVMTCQLPGCGNYFMRIGASRQLFCCTQHRQRAADKQRGRGRGRV